jgi:arginyl-tRNA synthetase
LKFELTQLLVAALKNLEGGMLPQPVDPAAVTLERTRDPKFGDFASNVAMRLARGAGRNPRELAAAIVQAIPPNTVIARAQVAGAGFINFFLARSVYLRELAQIHDRGAD